MYVINMISTSSPRVTVYSTGNATFMPALKRIVVKMVLGKQKLPWGIFSSVVS